jgi:AraC-like DNA-binding protein
VLRGEADVLEIEEEVMGIVATALAQGYRHRPAASRRGPVAIQRHRELADAARMELIHTLGVNRSVHDLARSLSTSPFHLCRVFKACTGRTMHAYRTELRVRRGLELLEEKVSLSAVAYDLGFASHAHFVRATRNAFAAAPSVLRAAVLARSQILAAKVQRE